MDYFEEIHKIRIEKGQEYLENLANCFVADFLYTEISMTGNLSLIPILKKVTKCEMEFTEIDFCIHAAKNVKNGFIKVESLPDSWRDKVISTLEDDVRLHVRN